MTAAPAAEADPQGVVIEDRVVDGPHGPVPVRTYRPAAPASPGLVWLHGGGFWAGDLDTPEGHWVARSFAERGVAVVSVDYALAPALVEGEQRPGRVGAHHPVPVDDVIAAFAWAESSGLAGPWALGGTSAGGNLAAAASLAMTHRGGVRPALAVLAYPTLLAVQPAPDPALRAALDADPDADRFGPDVVRGMYENYLGGPVEDAPLLAVPGRAATADLDGYPPVIMINAEVDELRVSGEVFARTLGEAGGHVDVSFEPGTTHGYLNRPEEPAATASIERYAARILALA
ncbi:alpha/beta hydrolase [Microbacterium sp. 22242]|uniref:alpha/beta hydrolase n=1 Tax=Microbacterium sp. 22242 TaxID=3453896 RepID=UPI003F844C9C